VAREGEAMGEKKKKAKKLKKNLTLPIPGKGGVCKEKASQKDNVRGKGGKYKMYGMG